jgi:protein involved in polysaccharide export with SLBB domain
MGITGEVNFPGTYSINDGDTILSIIERAGGLKDNAYTIGAVFTREDVAAMQAVGFQKSAEILEKAMSDSIMSANANTDSESYAVIREIIDRLKNQEPNGRQVVEIDAFMLKSDPRLNFSVHDGDNLFIPQRVESVSVMGEVMNQVTLAYKNDLGIADYIELSGGLGKNADKSRIFIIQPNGQSITFNNKLFGRQFSNVVLPGSTIFVSREIDSFNWMELTSIITPILSDLALSAAAVAAINNN